MKTSIAIEITPDARGYQIDASWTNESGPAASSRWVSAEEPNALEQVERISREMFERAAAAQVRLLASEAGARVRPSPHRVTPLLPHYQPPEHTARYLATDDARVAQAIADLRDDLGESED